VIGDMKFGEAYS
jgi:translation initiation factor IF-3